MLCCVSFSKKRDILVTSSNTTFTDIRGQYLPEEISRSVESRITVDGYMKRTALPRKLGLVSVHTQLMIILDIHPQVEVFLSSLDEGRRRRHLPTCATARE